MQREKYGLVEQDLMEVCDSVSIVTEVVDKMVLWRHLKVWYTFWALLSHVTNQLWLISDNMTDNGSKSRNTT